MQICVTCTELYERRENTARHGKQGQAYRCKAIDWSIDLPVMKWKSEKKWRSDWPTNRTRESLVRNWELKGFEAMGRMFLSGPKSAYKLQNRYCKIVRDSANIRNSRMEKTSQRRAQKRKIVTNSAKFLESLDLQNFVYRPVFYITRKHSVLETGFCFRLRVRGGRHLLCCVPWKELTSIAVLALSNRPNRVGVSLPSPEDSDRS
jgi:predicted O-linked N-acetylglucosamine transferase (SPINDLY family)